MPDEPVAPEIPDTSSFAIGFDARDRERLHELWDAVLDSDRWAEGPMVERYLPTGDPEDLIAHATEVCWPVR